MPEGGSILLLMQDDPNLEWQRLSEHYRQMSDEELRELAADFADLTDLAQQTLRSEMRSRGLGNPEDVNRAPEGWRPATIGVPQASNAPLESNSSFVNAGTMALGARPPQLVPDGNDTQGDENQPHEYTWKTLLCECETTEQVSELREALRRAGIESWIEGPRTYSRYVGTEFENPRVMVAADQLDQARAIAARPIPQEIVEASKVELPEFVEPKCPRCGLDDVVLEGVDAENRWRCEQCGERWADSGVAGDETAPKED